MPSCLEIESDVTPYIDGELSAGARERLEAHLRVCRACHARVAAERAVRDLVRARQPMLRREVAPGSLRGRCAAAAAGRGVPRPGGAEAGRWAAPFWRERILPVAVAASLVVLVIGAFVYQARLADQPARALATELMVDHLRCFAADDAGRVRHEPPAVESAMVASFGWRPRRFERFDAADLQLVDGRPCLFGRVAHLLYRHHGLPVSVFMVPNEARRASFVEVMGHEAVIWSTDNRTFVLIAKESQGEVQRMAEIVRAAIR